MALVQDLSMSDDALVARVRDGDDVAFEGLYGRYGGRIGGYVAGMVGDAGRAEDVTQEVFVSALRRMRATDRPIHFKPWIYEIARNAAIDEHRRNRRQREVCTAHESDHERPGLDAFASGAPAPEQVLVTREALSTLTSALDSLSEVHRRVIVLRELEGRSYEEIAAATGLTRGAVESALFRARKHLGAEYAELVTGRRCRAVRELVAVRGRRLRTRERGTLRRHLSQCRPCRRHAAAHGFDPASVDLLAGPRRQMARAAGLLPLPAWAQVSAGAGDAPIAWGKALATTAVVLAAGGTGVVASYDDPGARPVVAPAPAAATAAGAAPVAREAAAPRTPAAVRAVPPYRAAERSPARSTPAGSSVPRPSPRITRTTPVAPSRPAPPRAAAPTDAAAPAADPDPAAPVAAAPATPSPSLPAAIGAQSSSPQPPHDVAPPVPQTLTRADDAISVVSGALAGATG